MYIASLNVQGMRMNDKRITIEDWMKKPQILIMTTQETHIGVNQKEIRKDYHWYYSGEIKQGEKSHGQELD